MYDISMSSWTSNMLLLLQSHQLQKQSAQHHHVKSFRATLHRQQLIIHCPINDLMYASRQHIEKRGVTFVSSGKTFYTYIHSVYRFIQDSEFPSCQDVQQRNGNYLDCSTMRDTKLLSLFLFVAFVEVQICCGKVSVTQSSKVILMCLTAQQLFYAVA